MTARKPFALVVREHGPAVHRFLLAVAGTDRADDCWQETFLAALEAYPTLRDPGRVRSWLFQIANRKAIDSHRSARRAVPMSEPPEQVAPPDRGPEDGEIWIHVRRLPPKQRTAVAHRFAADLPYREVARAMGTSEAAARRNVHDGLEALRRRGAALV